MRRAVALSATLALLAGQSCEGHTLKRKSSAPELRSSAWLPHHLTTRGGWGGRNNNDNNGNHDHDQGDDSNADSSGGSPGNEASDPIFADDEMAVPLDGAPPMPDQTPEHSGRRGAVGHDDSDGSDDESDDDEYDETDDDTPFDDTSSPNAWGRRDGRHPGHRTG